MDHVLDAEAGVELAGGVKLRESGLEGLRPRNFAGTIGLSQMNRTRKR
jgi:hypothetical protein